VTRTLFALFVALTACSTELGPSGMEGPFDREVVELCSSRTSSVGVLTRGGGRITIELNRPGCPVAGCEGSDVYAPGAWATVRTAGPDLLLDGCDPISAVGADRLRVIFTPEEGAPETLDIDVVGACLVGDACASSPDTGVVDSGAPMDAATTDADASDARDAVAD